METITIIVLSIIGLIVLFVWYSYNSLVGARNRQNNAWADIDVQLKRRYDLIPNLLATVKGFAAHEKGVLEEVTKARSMAMNAQGVAQHADAENMLSGTLKSLFALSENYPTIKADTNFLQLQKELSDTEDKIQASRRFYNATVQDLMDMTQMFPHNIIAGMFSFKAGQFFEIANQAERENVKVQF